MEEEYLYLKAKKIAIEFSKQLGFVNREALRVAETKGELEVIPEIGFANYHHRRDNKTTIYEIAVSKEHQKQGWGRLLFYRVLCSAIENGSTVITLKCSVDLESNGFYEKLGFSLIDVESGRRRNLNVWQYPIVLPLLFYCAAGGSSPYDEIAKVNGWRIGACSNIQSKNNKYHWEFVDNEYEKYIHNKHLLAVKKHKPLLATAKDIQTPEELEEILSQAEELSKYCGRLLLIPKCEVEIPDRYWIGYSVPSGHGKTTIAPETFKDRFVHLLGGSVKKQRLYFSKMPKVVSLDGNYAMRLAKHGKSTWLKFPNGIRLAKHGKRINYRAFEISMKEIFLDWRRTEEDREDNYKQLTLW